MNQSVFNLAFLLSIQLIQESTIILFYSYFSGCKLMNLLFYMDWTIFIQYVMKLITYNPALN